jgi:hypothetical protein
MKGHTTPYETDTLKGEHRAAVDKLERRFRLCEPAFGVHPSGCPFPVSFVFSNRRNAPVTSAAPI